MNDYSWQISYNDVKRSMILLPSIAFNVPKRKKQIERKDEKRQSRSEDYYDKHAPLLIAASNGSKEIVELFLVEHPESVNHVSEDEQNILHIAVKHRQLEIFKLLKKNKSFHTLASRLSKENRTVFQLQAELKWYKRVKKVVPSHLHWHSDHMRLTAGDVLDIKHDGMLADAQQRIKQTAESCSTVSALVATVVFTAAYTIPGGSENGTPALLSSPVFIFFTVMDIIALAFSLASVVMFLSIITSPFELWDFHKSLPHKLNMGFTFLFCSPTATMLAFSATILLTIWLPWKEWTSTLVYRAAFFPVTVFGLVEFPLYMRLPSLLYKIYKKIVKIFVKEKMEILELIPIDRVIKRD